MNTHPTNPFTGLKGALAGLMSGGWLGLLLGLLFRRRIAPMLVALEKLFEQFRAGTLPVPATPARIRAASQAPAARAPAASRAGARPNHSRRPAAPDMRQPVAHPAVLPVQEAAWKGVSRLACPKPALRAPLAVPRHARCTENRQGKAYTCTPKLFRYRN
jgi:hypothetical protein